MHIVHFQKNPNKSGVNKVGMSIQFTEPEIIDKINVNNLKFIIDKNVMYELNFDFDFTPTSLKSNLNFVYKPLFILKLLFNLIDGIAKKLDIKIKMADNRIY